MLPAVGGLWTLVVSIGLGGMHLYETTQGAVGARQPRWPEDSRIRPDPAKANLILMAHPLCPCTRASIDAVEQVAARYRDSLAIHIAFYQPGGDAGGWGTTELHRRAAAIPGARVVDDPDGIEAGRFGALTSGHTLVYDRGGTLLFTGGLTASRNGVSRASETVVDLLSEFSATLMEAPVFGCPIRETPITLPNK